MDETNPTDTTANRAATNPVPAAQGAASVDTAAVDRAAATISEKIVPAARKTPVPPAPSVISVPVPPAPPSSATTASPIPSVPVQTPIQSPSLSATAPPQVQTIQPPSPAQSAPENESAPATAGLKPVAQSATEQPAVPLREDIARIIGKIKLPERITVRMSGEKAKASQVSPPASATQAQEEMSARNVALPNQTDNAQTRRENAGIQKGQSSSVVSLHTLKDDVQEAVRENKMSLVRAVALEGEKKKGQEHLAGPQTEADKARSHKLIGIAFVIVIIFALGGIALFGARSILKRDAVSIGQSDKPSLMFAEKTVTFPVGSRTGTDLKRTLIVTSRNEASVPLGAIVHVIPTSSETGADGKPTETGDNIGDFLSAIESHATEELTRSFRGDFFFGLHQTAEKPAPVLVIPVNSYERAFAGMLSWESTMNEDLSPVFIAVPSKATDENGLFVQRQFQDMLINNYDIRALKDDSGATRLLYSFPTRTMLIIAESPYSFTEVLSRLRASRQL